VAQRGTFAVVEDPDSGSAERIVMQPEKRRYLAGGDVMTEAAIDAGLLRDLYISLGEPLEDGAWAVRVQIKPFVRWIWLGGLMMALGGVLAIMDARYRRLGARARERERERRDRGAPAGAAAPLGGAS
jgi:cytochrome c-type biogenesis protein CcmF